MNDPIARLAPLGSLLGEIRLVADRYDLVMPDGSRRYGDDGSSGIRLVHADARAGRDAADALDAEIARIEAMLDRLWQHVPGAVADAEGDAYDATVLTLTALRNALVPDDPYEGLGIADRLRLKARLVDEAATHGRGTTAEDRQWAAEGPGRIRVLEDVCLLLEEAAGHPNLDDAARADVAREVARMRGAQVGREGTATRGAPDWRTDSTGYVLATTAFARSIADRIEEPRDRV